MPTKPTKKKQGLPAAQTSLDLIKPEETIEKRDPFPIIGMGASAGGLETLSAFFSIIPPDCNMAFVVIQHLSPHHKSIMASLLGKQTRMNVTQIEDRTKIQANHVYLSPPGKNVAIFNRSLCLLEPDRGKAINMPIDSFFRSLSKDLGDKAIGIILSGTASDGTLGIKRIKEKGGMTMVQQPDTAKYDGMPRSAVNTGLIDFILPVEKIPEALIQYVQQSFHGSPARAVPADSPKKTHMEKIFALMRKATGHDFSHYKSSTISRRIERRLTVHQIENVSDYILYLQKNPDEIHILFKNLLIGVTSFFRNPKAYKVLEQDALLNLLERKLPDAKIRCWVAGCSTGEEAYSIAILISELMNHAKKYFNIQIFATDIDTTAIDTARRGIFQENIGSDMPAELLEKYFTKCPGGFRINTQIREMIAFSIQNIIKDPPFSRLDLVSCRNLLIYMDSTLQKKIIPLFHYTLNPDGFLFLGTSETIGDHMELFEPVSFKWKIFKRKPAVVIRKTDSPNKAYDIAKYRDIYAPKIELPVVRDVQELVERVILDAYTPTGVLINDRYEILHFMGNTDKYLTPPMGKPSFNLLEMARQDLKKELMITLHKAVKDKEDATCKDVKVSYNGSFCLINILVRPMTDKERLPGFCLVMFEDNLSGPVPDKKSNPVKPRKKNTAIESLELELQSTREYLNAMIEELETSNEELSSANEELQSINEEMQSTNEELETSKEELQSTNEELSTVNSELQDTIDEYTKASDDMNNLLAATEIPTLFIDTNFCIKKFTPAAIDVIKLIPTDVGRPLEDLKTSFSNVDLVSLARNVLKDLNTLEKDILSREHIWYSLKIIPYRRTNNLIDGVVMTFVNVDNIKQADKFKRLAMILEDSNDAISVLDLNGNILAWNKGAQQMYGWTESEALKMNISDFLPDDRTDEYKSIVKKLGAGKSGTSFKTLRKTKNRKIIEVWSTLTVLYDETGNPSEIASTERDLASLTGV